MALTHSHIHGFGNFHASSTCARCGAIQTSAAGAVAESRKKSWIFVRQIAERLIRAPEKLIKRTTVFLKTVAPENGWFAVGLKKNIKQKGSTILRNILMPRIMSSRNFPIATCAGPKLDMEGLPKVRPDVFNGLELQEPMFQSREAPQAPRNPDSEPRGSKSGSLALMIGWLPRASPCHQGTGRMPKKRGVDQGPGKGFPYPTLSQFWTLAIARSPRHPSVCLHRR